MVVMGGTTNLLTMKSTLKKFVIIKTICLIAVLVTLSVWEAFVREPVLDWYSGDEIVVVRQDSAPTGFDLWMASSTVKEFLQIEYKKYLVEELETEINAYELKP